VRISQHVRVAKPRKNLVGDHIKQGKLNKVEAIGPHLVSRLLEVKLKLEYPCDVARIIRHDQFQGQSKATTIPGRARQVALAGSVQLEGRSG
jgi:hypothetical protein